MVNKLGLGWRTFGTMFFSASVCGILGLGCSSSDEETKDNEALAGASAGGETSAEESGGTSAEAGRGEAGNGGEAQGGREPEVTGGRAGETSGGQSGALGIGGHSENGGDTGSGGRAGSAGSMTSGNSTTAGETGLGGHVAVGGEQNGGAENGGGGSDGGTENGGGGAEPGSGGTAGVATNQGGLSGAGLGGEGGATGGAGDCAEYPGPCQRTTTSLLEGTTGSSSISYFYNEAGLLERTETGATPPEITRYTYDEAGRLVHKRTDMCDDPTSGGYCVDVQYTYDAQGNLLIEDDTASSVPFVIHRCTEYTYNESNLQTSSTSFDWCMGDATSTVTYEYDAEGRPIAGHDFGEDPSGPSADSLFEYGEDGFLAEFTLTDTSGNIVFVSTYTNDAQGNILSETIQYPDYDDYRIEYTRNEQGRELTSRHVATEGEDAGLASDCRRHIYDDCGRLLTWVRENYCDDTMRTTEEFLYVCPAP